MRGAGEPTAFSVLNVGQSCLAEADAGLPAVKSSNADMFRNWNGSSSESLLSVFLCTFSVKTKEFMQIRPGNVLRNDGRRERRGVTLKCFLARLARTPFGSSIVQQALQSPNLQHSV